jgi:hypothetical protein
MYVIKDELDQRKILKIFVLTRYIRIRYSYTGSESTILVPPPNHHLKILTRQKYELFFFPLPMAIELQKYMSCDYISCKKDLNSKIRYKNEANNAAWYNISIRVHIEVTLDFIQTPK